MVAPKETTLIFGFVATTVFVFTAMFFPANGLLGHIEPMEQFLFGFIGEFLGQLKSLANSSDNISDPLSRYLPGV